jgi:hypothetical protein
MPPAPQSCSRAYLSHFLIKVLLISAPFI